MIVSTGHSRAPRSGVLYPPASLGVVGSGQLGRMFIQAAQRMGYRAGVLTTADDDPAAQVANWKVIGASDELAALREFRAKAEAVTVEFENVSAAALRWLARDRVVRPGWQTAWICQNRLREKGFLARHRVPHTPWCAVRSGAELDAAVRKLGLPLILKTSSSGYDGKGQILVKTAEKAPAAWDSLGRPPAVAEALVDFAAELSVVVARGDDGGAVCYPVAMNRHEHHILDATVAPAAVGPIVTQEAHRLALAVAQAMGTVGVLTVEFFLIADGTLLVNEIAPRPHNSGHLTIEACVASQFEQQVRVLCGLPLGRPDLIMPAAMVNLLGDLWTSGNGEPRWEAALALDGGVSLHLYGKQPAVPGRKMGHLTVLDPDPDAALERALAARAALEGGGELARVRIPAESMARCV
jgi:5-(carboxyamino)imidazole ribonucleotide synthase